MRTHRANYRRPRAKTASLLLVVALVILFAFWFGAHL